MPTGYTTDIYEGNPITLRDFILRCARGMSWFIMQRDESMTEPPRKIQLQSYYTEAVSKSKSKIEKFCALTTAERRNRWQKYVVDTLNDNEERQQNATALENRYNLMIDKVINWRCDDQLWPLKDFMLSQLNDSKNFDCHVYLREVLGFEDWERETMESLQRSYDYAIQSLNQQRETVAYQNSITEKLYKSLENL